MANSLFDVFLGLMLIIILVALVFAWFAGFIGFTFNYLALRSHTTEGFNRWRDFPFWQAFFVGNIAIVFHPEFIEKTGETYLQRAQKYGTLLIFAAVGTTIVAIVRYIGFS